MNRILLLLIFFCLEKTLFAQHVYTIKADSVKITNNCDTAELIIENHTQNVPGFLFNKGRGRTEFRKGLVKLNDSLFRIGVDTLKIPRPSVITASEGLSMVGNTVQLGHPTGSFGALTSDRTVNLNGNSLRFSDGAVLLSKQVAGSASGNLLRLNSYWNTTANPSALRVEVYNTASTLGQLLSLYLWTDIGASVYMARAFGPRLGFDYWDYTNSIPYLAIRSNNINPGNENTYYGGGTIFLRGNYAPSAGYGMISGIFDLSNYAPTGGNVDYCSYKIQPIISTSSTGIVRGIYYGLAFENSASLPANNNIAFENYNGNLLLNNQAGDAGGRTAIHINGYAPTAWLHLGAGLATANAAPLKFTTGPVLTTPEDGAVEYDGADLYLTTGSVRYKLSKTLTGQLSTNFEVSSLAAWNSATTTLSVPGAEEGDVVMVNANSGAVNPSSIIITAYVTSDNMVTLKAYNASTMTVNISSDTYKVRVIK